MLAREVTFEVANELHAEELARTMRPADARELWAIARRRPLEGLLELIALSDVTIAGLVDGRVAALWGVIPPITLLAPAAGVWLYTSTEVDKNPVAFMRYAKRLVPDLLRLYPRLETHLDPRYAVARRWVERMGWATLWDGARAADGAPLVRLVLEAPHG